MIIRREISSSPLMLISLNLLSSILSFIFQLILFNSYAAEEYGLYRFSLVIYPLVVFLYNPGLDTIFLKTNLSLAEFTKQQGMRIIIFVGLFLTIQIGILNTVEIHNINIDQRLLSFMALGLLLGESQSSLRNFLFSHSLAHIIRLPLAVLRVIGILIGIFIINLVPPNASIGLLISIIFIGSGGPLSIAYLISIILRFKNELKETEFGSYSQNTPLRHLREGFKFTFSSCLLILNETILKATITGVIGLELYGKFSFLMLPVVEVQKITDMLAINYHQKIPHVFKIVSSVKQMPMTGINHILTRTYSMFNTYNAKISLISAGTLAGLCGAYYFSSLSTRISVGLGTLFLWFLLIVIKPTESICKLSGLLKIGYKFDVGILLTTLPLTVLFFVISKIPYLVVLKYSIWPSILLMLMVSSMTPIVFTYWIHRFEGLDSESLTRID